MISWVLATLVAQAAPNAVERVAEHTRGEFERVGRKSPERDKELDSAAATLAQQALKSGTVDATGPLMVTQALSAAGSSDPTPRVILVRGAPAATLEAFLRRDDIPAGPATHFGVGASVEPGALAIALVLVERKAVIDPFPRTLLPHSKMRPLCATLGVPFTRADLYVSHPTALGLKEAIEKLPMRRTAQRFCATPSFFNQGRHTVEILAHADRGPEVVALFFVQRGPSIAAAEQRTVEPSNRVEAKARLVDRINLLRETNGLPAVAVDPLLTTVAQAYSDRMAAENFFSHVDPSGGDLRSRLLNANYSYEQSGENLGLASGPMAAHFGIEHSPGHRKNLLEPAFTRVGIGVSERGAPGESQTVVTEILALPSRVFDNPALTTYRSIDSRRAVAHLRPLAHTKALEQLAQVHLARAITLDEPRTELDGQRIHDRVLNSLEDVVSTAADFYIADSPALGEDSRNLFDPSNTQVGVAAARNNSLRYGRGKYWVLVVYAAARR